MYEFELLNLLERDLRSEPYQDLDKVRFLSPVPVNSEVRIHTKCIDVTEKNPGQFLVKNEVSMEIKGVDKPAYIAETLSLFIT